MPNPRFSNRLVTNDKSKNIQENQTHQFLETQIQKQIQHSKEQESMKKVI